MGVDENGRPEDRGSRTVSNAWAERRHTDIESQAARLVSREQELDRQQQNYEQMESQWHIERTDYQAEIRRLLASLRDVELEELRAA